jgi:hypothetical protein
MVCPVPVFDVFFERLEREELSTVPGTAKPMNSQLQESHSKR